MRSQHFNTTPPPTPVRISSLYAEKSQNLTTIIAKKNIELKTIRLKQCPNRKCLYPIDISCCNRLWSIAIFTHMHKLIFFLKTRSTRYSSRKTSSFNWNNFCCRRTYTSSYKWHFRNGVLEKKKNAKGSRCPYKCRISVTAKPITTYKI